MEHRGKDANVVYGCAEVSWKHEEGQTCEESIAGRAEEGISGALSHAAPALGELSESCFSGLHNPFPDSTLSTYRTLVKSLNLSALDFAHF